MIDKGKLLKNYDNMPLVHYNVDSLTKLNYVPYDELSKSDTQGVLKACHYVDGKLMQAYSEHENHVGVIAATRLGKTTSYVIPTILSFAEKKQKRSMIISDPKGEVYRQTVTKLEQSGYEVKLLNFRDYLHSECWNVLTPIYRKYQQAFSVYDEVELVEVDGVPKNKFRGIVYDNQAMLDAQIQQIFQMSIDEVGNDIDNLATMIISVEKQNDPYWEYSARDVFKAYLWAMLEDSRPELLKEREDGDFEKTLITEETFSFNTIFTILNQFKDGSSTTYDDGDYFSGRPETSIAFQLAKNTFLENANGTRKCIMAIFFTKLSCFRDSAMRIITSCNSFDMKSISNTDKPVAIFINYRDELKTHYRLISLFVQDAYRVLIEKANNLPFGKLTAPFYFILDEFGNFPKIPDFETTISACAGRNIFFILIIQSYAQLESVYESAVAEIIKDNLNVHVFFGSNNPRTLEAFSKECGNLTRISPTSALNGNTSEIDHYQTETIPLLPVSVLSHLTPGECVITEANSGYVFWSRLERCFTCQEFSKIELKDEKTYQCSLNPFDRKYFYNFARIKKSSSFF